MSEKEKKKDKLITDHRSRDCNVVFKITLYFLLWKVDLRFALSCCSCLGDLCTVSKSLVPHLAPALHQPGLLHQYLQVQGESGSRSCRGPGVAATLLLRLRGVPCARSQGCTHGAETQSPNLTVVAVVLLAQSCPTLCGTDCSLPGFSAHGILQARILEWTAIPFSKGSFQPRNPTQLVSCTASRFFTIWATGKTTYLTVGSSNI